MSERRKIRLTQFPHAAVGPDGTLYVVWNEGSEERGGAIQIFLGYSTSFFPSVAADCEGAHIQYSHFCGSGGGTGNGTFHPRAQGVVAPFVERLPERPERKQKPGCLLWSDGTPV